MKKITINNEEYFYKTFFDLVIECDYCYTYFYKKKGTKMIQSRSFLRIPYGPYDKEVDNFEYQFELSIDIESPDYNKEQIKKEINNAISKKDVREWRKSEIEKGIII